MTLGHLLSSFSDDDTASQGSGEDKMGGRRTIPVYAALNNLGEWNIMMHTKHVLYSGLMCCLLALLQQQLGFSQSLDWKRLVALGDHGLTPLTVTIGPHTLPSVGPKSGMSISVIPSVNT